MTHKCMVTDCKEDAVKLVYDGIFWIKVCQEHYEQFKKFATDNNKIFDEQELVEKQKDVKNEEEEYKNGNLEDYR